MGSLQPRSLIQSNIPPCSVEESKLVWASHDEASASASAVMSNSNENQVSDDRHQIPYGHLINIQPNSSSSTHIPPASSNIIGKDGGGLYNNDLGEFDQALFLYLDGGQSPNSFSSLHQHKTDSGMRPATLNIFPSQPMHVEPSSTRKVSAMALINPSNVASKRPLISETSDQNTSVFNVTGPSSGDPPPPKAVKREGNHSGCREATNLEHDRPKTPDAKTLRRLAQNREAARKSRLRKKAYIQQLESSRVKLTQLEQEIQKSARAQGYATAGSSLVGEHGLPLGIGNLIPVLDAVVFDGEYGRWVEEHERLVSELRAAATQEHMDENELRVYVENCLSHFNEMMNLKCMMAKTDVFYLLSGTWKTPAERCFMWIAGFRPSHIIKMVSNLQLMDPPLSEQQLIGIYGLQESTMEAEEALSQGLDVLNQSISEVIISDSLTACPANMPNYMGQMSLAMAKLSTLQGFVRQADSLRHHTVHRLHQLLTTRQSANGLIAISEYFHRLRTLSSLWLARPTRQD